MIAIDRLQKLFDANVAVNDISLQIPTGSVCGLVGPNGAGKTTTLRCMAGLLEPTRGSVTVAGVCPERDPIAVRRVSVYVPDDPPLFDDLTVGGHLDFIARMYRIVDHRPKAAELLERFELLFKYDENVGSLSRGMRQKLAVACAYLADPEVLLLDEPLTGLDPNGIRALLDSIVQFASRGRTVVISSHLLAMIGDVCNRLIIMQGGQIRFQGSKPELRLAYPQAADLEAAFFAATDVSSTVDQVVSA